MASAFIACLVDLPEGLTDDFGPHITVVYADPPEGAAQQFDSWLDAVEDALATLPAHADLTGDVLPLGQGNDIRTAAIRCPALHTWRRDVLAGLAECGAAAPATWPEYRPHVTLAPGAAAPPAQAVPLGRVVVRVGDDAFTFGEQYAEISAEERRPTKAMAAAAQAVIDARQDLPPSRRALTPVGERRMHQIAKREPLSIDVWRRIRNFAARNARFAKAERLTPAWIAWGAWGGDDAAGAARRVLAIAERDDTHSEVAAASQAAWAECRTPGLTPPPNQRAAGDLYVGQPFRTTATGRVFCRHSGEESGRPITPMLLDDACRYFEAGEEIPLTWEHDPQRTLGRVLALWVVDDGDRHSLAVLPGLTPEGQIYVQERGGVLWSSPHLQWGSFHNPRTGAPVGGLRVKAVGLTTSPAQSHAVLDEVRLAERNTPGAPAMDDLLKMLAAAGAGDELVQKAREAADALPDSAEKADRMKAALGAVFAEKDDDAEHNDAGDDGMSAVDQVKAMVEAGSLSMDDLRGMLGDDAENAEGSGDEQRRDDATYSERVTALEGQVDKLLKLHLQAERKAQARAEAQTAEDEFMAGVRDCRWSEGDRAIYMTLRQHNTEAFEQAYGDRKPGHTGADARFSEGDTPAPRGAGIAGSLLDHIKDGESINACIERLKANPTTRHIAEGF